MRDKHKRKSLPIIKSEKNDFCNYCGANFPPILGEGHCKEWEKCLERQKEEE